MIARAELCVGRLGNGAIIGPGLKARTLANQRAEAAIGVYSLNRFTAPGMPVSLRIA